MIVLMSSLEISFHENNSHDINSHQINFPRDQEQLPNTALLKCSNKYNGFSNLSDSNMLNTKWCMTTPTRELRMHDK